jgi:pimeloyl-ACP methyl ester carboxylesterase
MRLPPVFLSLLLVPVTAVAQARLIGDWKGYWTRAGDTLSVLMHMQRDAGTGKYSATFDSDRLRVSGIPFGEVEVRGPEVTLLLRGDRATLRFQGRLRGDSLKGTFSEGSSEGGFAFARAARSRSTIAERSLTWTNGDVTLAGSLLMPSGSSAVPVVVFLHGSGAEGRWASRFLATELATHGIAALIYDKRGVGQSTGNWRQATPDDLARDAAAAVARLRQEPRIDARRIGLHGHSQGGTLAPFVAAQAPTVAFIIASAAAGQPMDSVEIFSILNSQLPEATSAADSANARSYVSDLVAVAYRGQPRARLDSLATALHDRPWFFAPPAPDDSYWTFSKAYAQYQPLEWWAKVHVPVLLIYGAEDQRVPARESAARISGALERNVPDVDVTVRILPGADHTFRLPPGPSGWPVTAPDYVPTLLRWLSRR